MGDIIKCSQLEHDDCSVQGKVDGVRFLLCPKCGETLYGFDPVIETTIEPVVETTIEPVVETTIEPVVETTIEPVVETTIEPAVETTIEPEVSP